MDMKYISQINMSGQPIPTFASSQRELEQSGFTEDPIDSDIMFALLKLLIGT
jgi:hypothetical protein